MCKLLIFFLFFTYLHVNDEHFVHDLEIDFND